jgi:hypothetical protein
MLFQVNVVAQEKRKEETISGIKTSGFAYFRNAPRK